MVSEKRFNRKVLGKFDGQSPFRGYARFWVSMADAVSRFAVSGFGYAVSMATPVSGFLWLRRFYACGVYGFTVSEAVSLSAFPLSIKS